MVAAPQFGYLSFFGQQSGQVYVKDLYGNDVVAGLTNMDSGNGAGTTSETFWRAPEDLILRDFAIHTGMTDTTAIRLSRNGVPTGDTLRYAAHLDTSTGRPVLQVSFPAGSEVRATQIA